MKKILIFMMLICSVPLSGYASDCSELSAKYSAPDPASKTMKQVKRWVKRKLKGSPDSEKLEACLIAQAADNPNKSMMAGK